MTQKTPVQLIIDKFETLEFHKLNHIDQLNFLENIRDTVEKEVIEDSYMAGIDFAENYVTIKESHWAYGKKYYNETFKND